MPDDSLPLPLTPSAFLESLAARLGELNGANSQPVLLRGIPMKSRSTDKIYGGHVYAEIRDPRTTETINVRLPEQLVATIEWGREGVFLGLLRFSSSRGSIRPEFRLDAVHDVGSERLLSKDEQIARWSQAAARPKRDARAALQKQRPRVVLITGNASVAVDDVRSQLREAEADLDLEVVRVPINQPREVVRALQEAASADAVAIVRGGGKDVQELDEDGLIGAVASAPVPVLAALGHATDNLVLGRVADASFPTPTALGAWLRETVEQRWLHERRLEEARLLSGAESLVEGVRQLEAARRSAAVWRAVAAVLAVALGAGVVWLLVRGA